MGRSSSPPPFSPPAQTPMSTTPPRASSARRGMSYFRLASRSARLSLPSQDSALTVKR
jgi:hypothetical protein